VALGGGPGGGDIHRGRKVLEIFLDHPLNGGKETNNAHRKNPERRSRNPQPAKKNQTDTNQHGGKKRAKRVRPNQPEVNERGSKEEGKKQFKTKGSPKRFMKFHQPAGNQIEKNEGKAKTPPRHKRSSKSSTARSLICPKVYPWPSGPIRDPYLTKRTNPSVEAPWSTRKFAIHKPPTRQRKKEYNTQIYRRCTSGP